MLPYIPLCTTYKHTCAPLHPLHGPCMPHVLFYMLLSTPFFPLNEPLHTPYILPIISSHVPNVLSYTPLHFLLYPHCVPPYAPFMYPLHRLPADP